MLLAIAELVRDAGVVMLMVGVALMLYGIVTELLHG